jgi:hypothetical protein
MVGSKVIRCHCVGQWPSSRCVWGAGEEEHHGSEQAQRCWLHRVGAGLGSRIGRMCRVCRGTAICVAWWLHWGRSQGGGVAVVAVGPLRLRFCEHLGNRGHDEVHWGVGLMGGTDALNPSYMIIFRRIVLVWGSNGRPKGV